MSIIIDSIRGTDILIAFTKLKKLLKFIFSKSCGDVLIDSQKKTHEIKMLVVIILILFLIIIKYINFNKYSLIVYNNFSYS